MFKKLNQALEVWWVSD